MAASLLASLAIYAHVWDWGFAVGCLLLLAVHELGHVLALRREGIRASAPMFVPFVGALVAMRDLPSDAAAEARVGLAGPLLGAAACLVPWALHEVTGDELFELIAVAGLLLNLVNLLPVLPLDGGRAMAALAPWMWLVGYGALIGATLVYPNPLLLLILVLGGIETRRRWRSRDDPDERRYLRVRPRTRAMIAAVYLGLATLLALGAGALLA
jgi:Zn-dependent protease